MFASTHVFDALPLSPARPSPVSRCSVKPPTDASVAALTIVVPTTAEVICTVHEPVVPTVVQVLVPPTKLPGPETIENAICVPAGAFAKPRPEVRRVGTEC